MSSGQGAPTHNSQKDDETAINISKALARALIEQAGLHEISHGPVVILDNTCGSAPMYGEIYKIIDEHIERMNLACSHKGSARITCVQRRTQDIGATKSEAGLVNVVV